MVISKNELGQAMGKNRSTANKAHRAMQQQIQAGMSLVTKGAYLVQPTKAERSSRQSKNS
jgi:hypothetical protein